MAFESFSAFANPTISLVALLSVIISIIALFKILAKKAEKSIKETLFKLFLSLSIGFVLFALAELVWAVYDSIGLDPMFGWVEYVYILGYLVLFIGLNGFLIYLYKNKGSLFKRLCMLTGLQIAIVIVSYYLAKLWLIPPALEIDSFSLFTLYFYPIGSLEIVALIFLVWTSLKEGKIGNFFLLLLTSQMFTLIGDIAYTYYAAREIYGIPGIVSDCSYIVYYLFVALAFLYLFRMLDKSMKEEEPDKNSKSERKIQLNSS